MAYEIKSKPEDFVVREVLGDEAALRWKDKIAIMHGRKPKEAKGGYLWMTMKKTDTGMLEAVGAIARRLGIMPDAISFSGTKDKRAVTCQTISIRGADEERIRSLGMKGVELSGIRQRDRPVRLGEHAGNEFSIVIRGLDRKEAARMGIGLDAVRERGMINLFGEQRFGRSGTNAKAGCFIVKGDARGAVDALLSGSGDASRGYESALKRHLEDNEGDFIGALKRVPAAVVRLLIHAYQAQLWNSTAGELISKGCRTQAAIPVLGYRTSMGKYPDIEEMIGRIIKKEGLRLSDFRVRLLPGFASRGSERELLCFPKRLSYSCGEDEDVPGCMKIVAAFFLGKGSYATELISQASRGWPDRCAP